MELTLIAKVQLYPSPEQAMLLQQTTGAYCEGCNWVSRVVEATHCLQQAVLHTETYRPLRSQFGLRSQMAQSVIKTVIARYKSVLANGHPWTRVQFTKPALDLVWNRDYSLQTGQFSLNTLDGRLRVPFAMQGMERFFNGSWQFGTAHLVHRHGRWFLHVPMTAEIPETHRNDIRRVVGLDFGSTSWSRLTIRRGERSFFPAVR